MILLLKKDEHRAKPVGSNLFKSLGRFVHHCSYVTLAFQSCIRWITEVEGAESERLASDPNPQQQVARRKQKGRNPDTQYFGDNKNQERPIPVRDFKVKLKPSANDPKWHPGSEWIIEIILQVGSCAKLELITVCNLVREIARGFKDQRLGPAVVHHVNGF